MIDRDLEDNLRENLIRYHVNRINFFVAVIRLIMAVSMLPYFYYSFQKKHITDSYLIIFTTIYSFFMITRNATVLYLESYPYGETLRRESGLIIMKFIEILFGVYYLMVAMISNVDSVDTIAIHCYVIINYILLIINICIAKGVEDSTNDMQQEELLELTTSLPQNGLHDNVNLLNTYTYAGGHEGEEQFKVEGSDIYFSTGQGICPIELTHYQVGDSVVVLDCNHHFSAEGSRNWLYRNNSCPVCRQCVDV